MKFPAVFYSLVGSSIVLAQEDALSDDVNRNLNNLNSQFANSFPSYFQEIALSQGVSEQKAAKDMFLYYGCYCFGAEWLSAGPRNNYHGPPVDKLDNLCYKLYRAQSCLKNDMLESGEGECDVHEKYITYREKSTNLIKCGRDPKRFPDYNTNPANACKMRTCALEQQFVQSVVDLLKTDFEAQPDEFNFNKKTDKYLTNCPTGKGTNNNNNAGNNKQCCGDGFNRRPYNDVMHSCCVDGQVTSFGSCP